MERDEKKSEAARHGETTTDAGVRKTAVFLSILDEKSAREMKSRLEPAVARAVEAEMKRVENLAPEAVEAVVAEFLALNEKNGEKTNGATLEQAGLRKSNLTSQAAVAESIPPKKKSLSGLSDDFWALDSFDAETIANILIGERASTIAVVASRLSAKRRDELFQLLPVELTKIAARLAATLDGTTETSQFLEDAVFNRALDDE